jgi:hypothetical protein
MALNVLRDALGRAGLRAYHQDSPFKDEADAALGGFRAVREELEKQVKRGNLTPKVAREKAAEAAGRLRDDLTRRSEGYSPVPRAFLDRLIEASDARKRARDNLSIEGLQRETNRLLRQSLIEQQLLNRAGEFEGRAFVRPIHGGQPAPTLDRLLEFHETASHAGDEAAREWARRQLEGFRSRVVDPEDHRRIDLACERPDRVNPRIVGRYIEAMQGRDAVELETLAAQAIASRDANACTAAFLLARQEPGGPSVRWVRSVLSGLGEFPEASLETLRAFEADARRAEADAARAQAEYALALAEAEARFPGLEAPSAADVERHARVQSKPLAAPHEPIGLAFQRRGLTPEEFESLHQTGDE